MEQKEKLGLLDRCRSEQVAYFAPRQGHIHNPGMGIISMAISDHMVTGYTPQAREEQDRKKPFVLTRKMLEDVTALPYIDNLYLRVGWNDVQQERGKLSLLPEFEMAVEAAREAGISWGFRIMQASPSNPREHLLPDFLADKLPVYPYYDGAFYGPQPRKLPLYTEEYLKYWGEMLQLLAEKYDADPALEYADLSGFGLWGEGHHGCHTTPGGPVVDLELDPPARTQEVVARLIESHENAFTKTPMVLNLVMSGYEASKDAIRRGCWVRRDSYHKWFQADHALNGLERDPEAAMIFETVMPGIYMHDDEDPNFRYGYMEIPDRMCDYGASYGIVGFNIPDTLYADHLMPGLFDAFKNRLGYRLRPSIVWKLTKPDGRESLVLGMVNDGTVTPPGQLCFTAKSGGQTSRVWVGGGEFGGKMRLVELPLPEGHDKSVVLELSLKIREKLRPVRFAVRTGEQEAPFELTVRLCHENP
ncbi:MAG: hypothetical protein Q4C65_13445 [Eubacteriales bacterium]|nr:hypothetical protein [Eubacteriales bacterium]